MQRRSAAASVPDCRTICNFSTRGAWAGSKDTILAKLSALLGIMIAFGHSLLAMSGEETLAQVYREIAHPKLKNLKRTATDHRHLQPSSSPESSPSLR